MLGPVLDSAPPSGGLSSAAAGRDPAAGLVDGGRAVQSRRGRDRQARAALALVAREVVARSRGLNLLSCGVILCAFWLPVAKARARSRTTDCHAAPSTSNEPARVGRARLNLAKALVPLLPILLLTLDAMAGPVLGRSLSPSGLARILAAMLIGVAAAGLDQPRQDASAWRRPSLKGRATATRMSSR